MKLRSYNEELLIAAALMTDLFNDVVIERRKHGLERDYSKVIKVEDILQKNIEVPCIIGDRSAVLKSLENHEGAIKLPLFILQSQNIKVDESRIADLHYDLLYQPDQACTKLPKDNPHYKPYDLRKRRPVPITIEYKLTMVTKYKEDLDQMITNWIVHFRPDVYVKWYHPKYRLLGYTIQSQVIGGQSVTYKAPEDSGNKVYQYTGDTTFTFKTWLFTGLDYELDQPDDTKIGIIKYFNWFPTDINTTDSDGTEGYPTIGSVGSAPAGFYAVPSQMQFEAPEDATSGEIRSGKYFVNNITGSPTDAYPNGPSVNIKNVDADIFTKDIWQKLPNWNIYQDYCACDLVSNERFGIKFVYFDGGYPLSAWLNQSGTGPSGDFFLQHFCSIGNKCIRKQIGYFNTEEDEDFGMCYTESLKVKFDYNFETKTLTISGMNDNERYNCLMYSKMSSLSGIEQCVEIKNKPVYNNDMLLKINRHFNTNYEKINKYYDYTKNIQILNAKTTEKPGWKDNLTPVEFILETHEERRKILQLKAVIQKYWEQLEIYPCDNNGNKIDDNINEKYKFYKLSCDNSEYIEQLSAFTKDTKTNKFKSQLDTLKIDTTNLDLFLTRQQTTFNDKDYTVIVNKQLYFVLSDEGIYDWGIIVIPRFSYLGAPVFKSTIPNGQLLYGIGINGNVSPCINFIED